MSIYVFFFFFKQKTAYEMRISDWSSDVCSSDLAYLSASHEIINRIAAAEEAIISARGEPQGLLRINATFQFGREHIAPAISKFSIRYPEVQVQLVLTDAPLNLIVDGFDLQISFVPPTSTRHATARLPSNSGMLVAAPPHTGAL